MLVLAGLAHPEWIRYLLILCVLRLARVLTSVKRYSVIMTSFFSLWRVVTPMLGVTFCFSSIFCSIGIQLFGGKIYEGAPCIKGAPQFLFFRSVCFLCKSRKFLGLFWVKLTRAFQVQV